jgi:hypothetical protein
MPARRPAFPCSISMTRAKRSSPCDRSPASTRDGDRHAFARFCAAKSQLRSFVITASA